MDQIVKIARMKEDALTGKDLKLKSKEIIGTARSMGLKVEGMNGKDAIEAVEAGKFDASFK
jgi:hypothetical protein